MEAFQVDAFHIFDKQWALVTAGTLEDYNTMTISWGGLGTLWSRPVATVYVKPVRYTYHFLEKNDYFTVSFFPEEYKKDLGILGSKSGRNGDKVALTSLTPIAAEHGVTFTQASATLICKKITGRIWISSRSRRTLPVPIIKQKRRTACTSVK